MLSLFYRSLFLVNTGFFNQYWALSTNLKKLVILGQCYPEIRLVYFRSECSHTFLMRLTAHIN